jgi:hypothetical protein
VLRNHPPISDLLPILINHPNVAALNSKGRAGEIESRFQRRVSIRKPIDSAVPDPVNIVRHFWLLASAMSSALLVIAQIIFNPFGVSGRTPFCERAQIGGAFGCKRHRSYERHER